MNSVCQVSNYYNRHSRVESRSQKQGFAIQHPRFHPFHDIQFPAFISQFTSASPSSSSISNKQLNHKQTSLSVSFYRQLECLVLTRIQLNHVIVFMTTRHHGSNAVNHRIRLIYILLLPPQRYNLQIIIMLYNQR